MTKDSSIHIQTQLYVKDPEYCELLLACKDICNQIYIARNISLDNGAIIKALEKIDRLMRTKDEFD